MLKKLLKASLIGLGIGNLISIFWTYHFFYQRGHDIPFMLLLLWIIASALYGIASVLFDYLAIKKALIIHFLVCLSITLCAFYLMATAFSIPVYYTMSLSIFVVIYLIIYLAIYLSQEKESNELNKTIQAYKKRNN